MKKKSKFLKKLKGIIFNVSVSGVVLAVVVTWYILSFGVNMFFKNILGGVIGFAIGGWVIALIFKSKIAKKKVRSFIGGKRR